ncbi:hypothetical protein HNE05_07960 [Aquipseudomonas campi]|uniref:Uncharacterized protein n=1 Tax=Aquipseudomonas campi TaxID=2731681 RepID=A0A6M8FRA8_9GAMM|nr:hypothetical protein [Pseudomonas campi]QKE63298.1 hypothetical protein HNE05_07960 [Pseudomonas campi]
MAVQQLGPNTVSVNEIAWDGSGFGNAKANEFWSQLSSQLQKIAISELVAGNRPRSILRNDSRNIIVLSFSSPPNSLKSTTDLLRVHTEFKHGNYCYDGTACTYEDLESGDFLAFDTTVPVHDL